MMLPLILLLAVLHGSKQCPTKCKCFPFGKNLRVKCKGIDLVPKGIPPNTLTLWVARNFVQFPFSPSKFSVDCTYACKVFFSSFFRNLSGNSLKAIREGAFENLPLLAKLWVIELRTIFLPLSFPELVLFYSLVQFIFFSRGGEKRAKFSHRFLDFLTNDLWYTISFNAHISPFVFFSGCGGVK